MRIAVVTPAFNVAAFLADAIRSVLAQTHPDWTMVVVDDGSTDGSGAVAAGLGDSRIRVIRQPNAGVSAARNAGMRAVLAMGPSPDAWLFLDGDDWITPDALAVLSAALDATPGAVAATGRFARVGLEARPRVGPPPPHGNLLERLLTRNLFANGGHLLIRRESAEGAGTFRTELCYGEDWEYWVRLALLGDVVAVRAGAPLLFVRERLTGAYLSRATDPAAYRPALRAIYGNPEVVTRLGAARIATLFRRAEAEMAWTVGRELIRHGRRQDGLGWLARSVRDAPHPKRLVLLGLSWAGVGPFRPYLMVGTATNRQASCDLSGCRQCD